MLKLKKLFDSNLSTTYSDDKGNLIKVYSDGMSMNGKYIKLNKLEEIIKLIKERNKIKVKENAKHI